MKVQTEAEQADNLSIFLPAFILLDPMRRCLNKRTVSESGVQLWAVTTVSKVGPQYIW